VTGSRYQDMRELEQKRCQGSESGKRKVVPWDAEQKIQLENCRKFDWTLLTQLLEVIFHAKRFGKGSQLGDK